MAGVEQIPVAPSGAVRADHALWTIGHLCAGGLELGRRRPRLARAEVIGVGIRRARWVGDLTIFFRGRVDDARIGEERLRRIHERSFGDPASVFLAGFGAAPEAGEFMDVLADVDSDGLTGQGGVGHDDDFGDASKFERDLGRARDEAGLALKVGLKPEVLRQCTGMVVPMVEVR